MDKLVGFGKTQELISTSVSIMTCAKYDFNKVYSHYTYFYMTTTLGL